MSETKFLTNDGFAFLRQIGPPTFGHDAAAAGGLHIRAWRGLPASDVPGRAVPGPAVVDLRLPAGWVDHLSARSVRDRIITRCSAKKGKPHVDDGPVMPLKKSANCELEWIISSRPTIKNACQHFHS